MTPEECGFCFGLFTGLAVGAVFYFMWPRLCFLCHKELYGQPAAKPETKEGA